MHTAEASLAIDIFIQHARDEIVVGGRSSGPRAEDYSWWPWPQGNASTWHRSETKALNNLLSASAANSSNDRTLTERKPPLHSCPISLSSRSLSWAVVKPHQVREAERATSNNWGYPAFGTSACGGHGWTKR